MTYPIRYRFKDKDTGKVLERINLKREQFCNDFYLSSSGGVFELEKDNCGADFVTPEFRRVSWSIKEFILEIALTKDNLGNWIYFEVSDTATNPNSIKAGSNRIYTSEEKQKYFNKTNEFWGLNNFEEET